VTRPLTIGIDARELAGEATGVGKYLDELLARWIARADADTRQLVLYTPDAIPPRRGVTIRHVGSGAGRGTWWEQVHLRRAVSADPLNVFFAPAYTAPFRLSIPLAVTIHDISFVAHPEWFRPREGLRRRVLTSRAATRASVIFTDSEFSRTELIDRLRADSSRIRVIPPGVTNRATGATDLAHREPVVLFVGSLFNRRRLPDLIEAFARAARDLPAARLVIVGANRTWPHQDLREETRRHGVESRTEFRDYAPDAALAELYGRASVFAFLSEYEGFGMTPLEALTAGVPPIVLDTAVAREVYGDAAIFVAKGDVEGTAAALRSLLHNPSAGAGLVYKGRAVLERYSWDRAAAQTLAEIERVSG
jgi:glycosyltransferase involved in cell wall biosynthesis